MCEGTGIFSHSPAGIVRAFSRGLLYSFGEKICVCAERVVSSSGKSDNRETGTAQTFFFGDRLLGSSCGMCVFAVVK